MPFAVGFEFEPYVRRPSRIPRVPMADVGPVRVPDNVTDEQALFLSDIFPTGYMPQRTPKSKMATRLRSGAVGRLANLPSGRPS